MKAIKNRIDRVGRRCDWYNQLLVGPITQGTSP
ncbi:MAG TPA: hypothetical protein DEF41_09025 [Desulfovibrio sp.]|uniref:Uncharacterized protein n=1 Tax=Nitratidesulfovibrio vulgaris (strain ATCC 29579 / DSM 644 / CCUG 34227 / NCIMB 8303 / VKM B-1760 / Hildenborough) TaxID=882 RepID=Q727R9_NITV2|nr:hypothetical protein DVU_2786 [Nitratidesulfovibrio vulgaris str. Hildenborough]HBW16257.1 hypothetical protein [Desulfovibrio sp.]